MTTRNPQPPKGFVDQSPGPTVCVCTDHPRISKMCICWSTAVAVLALTAVREAFLADRNAQTWLNAYSRALDAVPLQLILDGAQLDDVVEEARRYAQAGAA